LYHKAALFWKLRKGASVLGADDVNGMWARMRRNDLEKRKAEMQVCKNGFLVGPIER
jgi:hypothetical protein